MKETELKGQHAYLLPILNPELLPNVRILALDTATHCGYAVSRELYGTWNLTPRRDESMGM